MTLASVLLYIGTWQRRSKAFLLFNGIFFTERQEAKG
jgi:hypothetical protein